MARPSSRRPLSSRGTRRGGAAAHAHTTNCMREAAHGAAEQLLAIEQPSREARWRSSHDRVANEMREAAHGAAEQLLAIEQPSHKARRRINAGPCNRRTRGPARSASGAEAARWCHGARSAGRPRPPLAATRRVLLPMSRRRHFEWHAAAACNMMSPFEFHALRHCGSTSSTRRRGARRDAPHQVQLQRAESG
jgi:hypothetical protein